MSLLTRQGSCCVALANAVAMLATTLGLLLTPETAPQAHSQGQDGPTPTARPSVGQGMTGRA